MKLLVSEGQSLETTAAGGKRRQLTNLAVLVPFNIRPDLNKTIKRFYLTQLFQKA